MKDAQITFGQTRALSTAIYDALQVAHSEHPGSRSLPVLHDRLFRALHALAAAHGTGVGTIIPDSGAKPPPGQP